ncbi:Hypothetical protein PBC10988_1100 [Planctomycetales bacterium 10988]|nr:Hypothetical protein PBC10988_1100 [Planctomycetales bacterium 10988]
MAQRKKKTSPPRKKKTAKPATSVAVKEERANPLSIRSCLRVLLPLAIFAIGFASFLYATQESWQETFTEQSAYRTLPKNLEVTSPPNWIRADVKDEVLKNHGFSQTISLLDSGELEQIASAFAFHPWVKTVKKVQFRYPSTAQVELDYRTPVLMVEVPGGLYPVDPSGVLLPSVDFTPKDAMAYPRLNDPGSLPERVGKNWGNQMVTEAAAISSYLVRDWQKLGLARIVPAKHFSQGQTNFHYWYYLVSQSGRTRVFWGEPPNRSDSDEPSPIVKLQRLLDYLQTYGSLEHPQQPQDLDLRSPQKILISPRLTDSPQKLPSQDTL